LKILLRVFCHAHGDRIILLLGGYDKGERPSARHQQAQIELARTRLKDWKVRQIG
jgi:putative component of toxin-antitoxin plasmid stabilization module